MPNHFPTRHNRERQHPPCSVILSEVLGSPIHSRFLRIGGKAQLQKQSGAARTAQAFALLCIILVFLNACAAHAQSPRPVVLDRVVAVVNNQAILYSDIDDEIRLSVLDPGRVGMGVLTRARALDQLIGRALIQQQIRQGDLESVQPSQTEVDERLSQIRRQLPSCVRSHCSTPEGWKAFLVLHNLTQERVESYLGYRLEILSFIEERFRQGINIQPDQIEAYYTKTLLPQYPKGEAIPPLDQVSARIQEILLQQQVNILFDDWLSNLRKQGNIEVLDPTIQDPTVQDPAMQGPAVPSPVPQSPSPEPAPAVPSASGKGRQ